jgi:hypothetical protein
MTNPQSEEKNTTEAQSKELNPSSNNEDFVPTVVHFSCKNCNIHISDTMWYYRSTPKILALDAACHIKYDDKLHFVPDGEDQGSSFFKIECSNCGVDLGRLYKTTPKSLDWCRDRFSLYWDRLNCFAFVLWYL